MTNLQWRDRADCRSHPSELWFPIGNDTGETGKKICRGCPVREACGREAIRVRETHSIAAGFRCSDPAERQELRIWLGLDSPPRESRTCIQCRKEFTTRNQRRRTCPDCRDQVALAPVTRHVRRLRDEARLTYRAIALRAQVSASSVVKIANGHPDGDWQHVARDVADRLLALPLPDTTPKAKIA
ncbi:WhiB family transcriptional regulator [Nocardia sp. NPDC059240]|uniref:WhiB family transcriptional regulator n=1 Tax=Nocardia sp. NPDC059240 TaxID=3346786 RepID=UPI0036C25739